MSNESASTDTDGRVAFAPRRDLALDCAAEHACMRHSIPQTTVGGWQLAENGCRWDSTR